MSRYAFMALAALAACSGPDDKGDSGGETGTTTTGCPPADVFTGPTLITSYSVACDANDALAILVETQGWTGGGQIFMQETANSPAWAETHSLSSYEFDICQEWDHLALGIEGTETLTTGVAVADQTPNASTVFGCGTHIEAGVMSYAVEVTDLGGAVAHCVAWGDDPDGMIADTASAPDGRVNEPGFSLAGCDVGTNTM